MNADLLFDDDLHWPSVVSNKTMGEFDNSIDKIVSTLLWVGWEPLREKLITFNNCKWIASYSLEFCTDVIKIYGMAF